MVVINNRLLRYPTPEFKDPDPFLLMTFFSAEKLKPRRIEIDSSRIGSNCPEVQKRLDRIQENYEQLESILAEMESKIERDERLKAIDDAEIDFETLYGVKKKRKWRSAKPKAKSKSKRQTSASTDPQKPR